jgi:hypothetical protein
MTARKTTVVVADDPIKTERTWKPIDDPEVRTDPAGAR